MFYILGVFRRTALWGIILLILATIAMGSAEFLYLSVYLFAAYLVCVLLHFLGCKISRDRRPYGEAYLSALGHDIAAPFTKFGLFIDVLFRKWIIHDNSRFHHFIDALQVVTGGIWSICVLGAATFLILSIFL